jgi:hypothetical protein
VHWGSLLFTISISYYATYRYWGIEGTVVTAWLAVDDADVENGCMQDHSNTMQHTEIYRNGERI